MTRHAGGKGDISTQQFAQPKISYVVWPLSVTVDIKHNSYRVIFSIVLKEARINISNTSSGFRNIDFTHWDSENQPCRSQF